MPACLHLCYLYLMIYDCFAFFNELDLLEIRLNTLDPVVDRFVLVECRYTFTKKPKPLYFEENKQRFARFLPKIEHIILDRFPAIRWDRLRVPHAWDCDNYQKEQLTKGLKKAKKGDVIIVSDVDEIPKPEMVKTYAGKPGIHVFEQYYCNYFLNTFSVTGPNDDPTWWRGSVMINFEDFKTIKRTRIYRGETGPHIHVLKDAGWHFSFLGGWSKVIHKLESFAHTEYDKDYFKDESRVKKIIEEGGDLFDSGSKFKAFPIDERLPEWVLKNASRYPELIRNPS